MFCYAIFASGSAYGGRDVKMFDCLVFTSRLELNKGIAKWFYHLPLLH
jgi:hypothetical protein